MHPQVPVPASGSPEQGGVVHVECRFEGDLGLQQHTYLTAYLHIMAGRRLLHAIPRALAASAGAGETTPTFIRDLTMRGSLVI